MSEEKPEAMSEEKPKDEQKQEQPQTGQEQEQKTQEQKERAQSKRVPKEVLVERVREALHAVVDPEIHFNVVELGLVYGLDADDEGNVNIKLTMTTPACPYAPMLVEQAYFVVGQIEGVESCKIDVVWEPPWDPRTMASEEVKLMLGIM